jgi:multidrug transporter EmrE-like cation transporter
MREKGLTPRIVLLVIAADILQFVIMVSFKEVSAALPTMSAASSGPVDPLNFVWLAVHSKFFWLGVACMIASFIVWPAVLAALDLSVAFPLGSMSFVVIPFLSIIFLEEQISPLRWLGILVITGGIALLSVHEKPAQELA